LTLVHRQDAKAKLFVFWSKFSPTHKSRRDEIFIDTRLLALTAPYERNEYRAFISLIQSLDWFVTVVAINILLLQS